MDLGIDHSGAIANNELVVDVLNRYFWKPPTEKVRGCQKRSPGDAGGPAPNTPSVVLDNGHVWRANSFWFKNRRRKITYVFEQVCICSIHRDRVPPEFHSVWHTHAMSTSCNLLVYANRMSNWLRPPTTHYFDDLFIHLFTWHRQHNTIAVIWKQTRPNRTKWATMSPLISAQKQKIEIWQYINWWQRDTTVSYMKYLLCKIVLEVQHK